jgi:hypothetical protein
VSGLISTWTLITFLEPFCELKMFITKGKWLSSSFELSLYLRASSLVFAGNPCAASFGCSSFYLFQLFLSTSTCGLNVKPFTYWKSICTWALFLCGSLMVR